MSDKLVPKYAFLISGVGRHTDRLQAFDRALIAAGPLAHNLVSVSSIIPSNCSIISAEKGLKMLTPGQITFCVMAKQDTNKLGEFASAAVGIARIKNLKCFGYISEYLSNIHGRHKAQAMAKRLAIEMLATKFNTTVKKLDLSLTRVTAASIKNTKDGDWVCSVALCIFVL